jgi:uncharacterized membrane protein
MDMKKENLYFGLFQLFIGFVMIFLQRARFVSGRWSYSNLIPLAMALFFIVYGLFALAGKIKIKRREPWEYKFLFGLVLAVILITIITLPKKDVPSDKEIIERRLINKSK